MVEIFNPIFLNKRNDHLRIKFPVANKGCVVCDTLVSGERKTEDKRRVGAGLVPARVHNLAVVCRVPTRGAPTIWIQIACRICNVLR